MHFNFTALFNWTFLMALCRKAPRNYKCLGYIFKLERRVFFLALNTLEVQVCKIGASLLVALGISSRRMSSSMVCTPSFCLWICLQALSLLPKPQGLCSWLSPSARSSSIFPPSRGCFSQSYCLATSSVASGGIRACPLLWVTTQGPCSSLLLWLLNFCGCCYVSLGHFFMA